MSKDTIYRQDAIDALCSVCGNDCDKTEFVYDAPQWDQVIMCPEHYVLSTLPSAEPERKTGKWINNSPVTMKCDQCGYVIKDWKWNELNFCANCGADMRGEQE